MHRSHDVKGTGCVSCDLDSKVKVKGQIMYFLENASHNVLEVTTSNLPVHRSHDVEGTRQHFI